MLRCVLWNGFRAPRRARIDIHHWCDTHEPRHCTFKLAARHLASCLYYLSLHMAVSQGQYRLLHPHHDFAQSLTWCILPQDFHNSEIVAALCHPFHHLVRDCLRYRQLCSDCRYLRRYQFLRLGMQLERGVRQGQRFLELHQRDNRFHLGRSYCSSHLECLSTVSYKGHSKCCATTRFFGWCCIDCPNCSHHWTSQRRLQRSQCRLLVIDRGLDWNRRRLSRDASTTLSIMHGTCPLQGQLEQGQRVQHRCQRQSSPHCASFEASTEYRT